MTSVSSKYQIVQSEIKQGKRGFPGPAGPESSFTNGADILAALLSVDGEGSGLDTDLFQGNAPSAFALAGHDHDELYLGINAKAADSEMLDGHDSLYFAPVADPTFSGTITAAGNGDYNHNKLTFASSSQTARTYSFRMFDTGTGGALGIYDDTAAAYRFSILDNGNIGVGTPSPNALFSVAEKVYIASDGTIKWGNSAGDYGDLTYGTGKAVVVGRSGKALSLGANDTPDMLYIKTDGNSAFGFTNPLAKLAINGGLHVGGESDPGDNNLMLDGEGSSPSFTAGFTGSGWKLSLASTDYSLELDNLTVRNKLTAYELEIREINSIGGGLIVSVANGTAYDVADQGGGVWRIYFDEDGTNNQIQFAANDYVRAQAWTGRGIGSFAGQVTSVVHSSTLGSAYIVVSVSSGTPWKGMKVVQVGNSSDDDRQNIIYITAADTNNPYIDMLAAVDDGDFSGKQKLRIGNLTGITDASFGGALSGYGLYGDNVYLKGSIVASAGSIGGWTINETYLAKDTGTAATSSGMAPADYPFYAGATYTNRATSPFNVTPTGALTAIGDCTLGSSTGVLTLGTSGNKGEITVYSKIKFYGIIYDWPYSIQNDTTLTSIAYPLYFLDASDVSKTLTLPGTLPDTGTKIEIANPTKGTFTISGNGNNIYLNTGTPVASFNLTQGQTVTLIVLNGGYPGWYQIN